MARKSGFIRRDGRMRRETQWLFYTSNDVVLAAASTASVRSSLNAAALALRPFTVIRTRGHWGVKSDQAGASEQYSASMGWVVVSDQASTVGVTAVPTPETDRGSDLWYVYESMAGEFIFISGVGVFEAGHWSDFDSRAARKVEEGQDINVIVESSAISSGCEVFSGARFLIKLH